MIGDRIIIGDRISNIFVGKVDIPVSPAIICNLSPALYMTASWSPDPVPHQSKSVGPRSHTFGVPSNLKVEHRLSFEQAEAHWIKLLSFETKFKCISRKDCFNVGHSIPHLAVLTFFITLLFQMLSSVVVFSNFFSLALIPPVTWPKARSKLIIHGKEPTILLQLLVMEWQAVLIIYVFIPVCAVGSLAITLNCTCWLT